MKKQEQSTKRFSAKIDQLINLSAGSAELTMTA